MRVRNRSNVSSSAECRTRGCPALSETPGGRRSQPPAVNSPRRNEPLEVSASSGSPADSTAEASPRGRLPRVSTTGSAAPRLPAVAEIDDQHGRDDGGETDQVEVCGCERVAAAED